MISCFVSISIRWRKNYVSPPPYNSVRKSGQKSISIDTFSQEQSMGLFWKLPSIPYPHRRRGKQKMYFLLIHNLHK